MIPILAGLLMAAPPTRAQALVFLQYAHAWDTPEDDRAVELVRRLSATDGAAFLGAVKPGSEERALVDRYLRSFDQAALLLEGGAMAPAIYFDAWYDVEGHFRRAKPWIAALRAEAGQPGLYPGLEWLAGRAAQFWAERAKSPLPEPPPDKSPPTPEDAALFYAFEALWSGTRDVEAEAFVQRLAREATDFAAFERLAPTASHEYTAFDRYFCEFDQAAVLAKLGLLRVDLLASWRSAAAAWAVGKKWIVPLREKNASPHLFESIEWLARREVATKKALAGAAAAPR